MPATKGLIDWQRHEWLEDIPAVRGPQNPEEGRVSGAVVVGGDPFDDGVLVAVTIDVTDGVQRVGPPDLWPPVEDHHEVQLGEHGGLAEVDGHHRHQVDDVVQVRDLRCHGQQELTVVVRERDVAPLARDDDLAAAQARVAALEAALATGQSERLSLRNQLTEALGVGAEAEYVGDGDSFTITILADNPMVGAMSAMIGNAAAMGMKVERIGREKFAVQDDTVQGLVDNRILVKAEGGDVPTMLKLLEEIDYRELGRFGQ